MKKPLLSIGLCQFGLSIQQTLFMFYYVKVYLNQFHVNTKWFNISQTLFMIWNTINDPLFGYLQDIPGSWFNNRLNVIKYLSPFLIFSFIFMWFPWDTTNSDIEGIHLIISLFLYDAFFSAIGVAWGAFFADTTKGNSQNRIKALKYSQIAILCSVFSIAVTEKLTLSLNNFQTFQIICVLIAIAALLCLWYGGNSAVKNNKTDLLLEEENEETSRSAQKLSFKSTFSNSVALTKQILTQRKFMAIIFANFFQTGRSIAHMNFASIITEVVIPQDILPSGSFKLSLFFAILTLGPQILLILNEKFINRLGAMNVLQYSYILSFFSGFLIIFSSNPIVIMLFMLIDCVTVHSSAPLFNILISDFVDDDAKKNRRSSSIPSIVFSLNALFVKPAQSIAPVIIVHILNGSGYQEFLKNKMATVELKNTVLNILFMTPLFIGAAQYLILKVFHSGNNSKAESFTHTV